MGMGVAGYGARERGHLDLGDSPADDRLAGREAFEDLHPGAVGRAQLDFPFDVCFRIELHENRVDALVLRYGAERNGQRFGPERESRKTSTKEPGITSPPLLNSNVTGM